MKVLFTSSRPLGRCENITAVWNAYKGEKGFAQIDRDGNCPEAGKHRGVIVTDEFLKAKGPGATVVNIEHGCAGGKLYGLDQRVRYYTTEQTALVDYFVVSSRYGTKFAASEAGIPEHRCLPLGMPRTDAYVGKRKGDGGTFLAKYERAYLYAPTLRAGWDPPRPRVDWAAVSRQLEDGEVLVVKPHMISGDIVECQYNRIIQVPSSDPSTPYLIDCDVLLTDYSSIMFDGYLLDKPCVLWCPDKDDYLRVHGMYLDYPWGYSSYIATKQENLIPMARTAFELGMGENEKTCRSLTADMCDGDSTRRVIELIEEL